MDSGYEDVFRNVERVVLAGAPVLVEHFYVVAGLKQEDADKIQVDLDDLVIELGGTNLSRLLDLLKGSGMQLSLIRSGIPESVAKDVCEAMKAACPQEQQTPEEVVDGLVAVAGVDVVNVVDVARQFVKVLDESRDAVTNLHIFREGYPGEGQEH